MTGAPRDEHGRARYIDGHWYLPVEDYHALRDDAQQVVLDALAWLDPESAKRLMAASSYQRFKERVGR